MLDRVVRALERFFFTYRRLTLAAFAAFTAVMAVFALQLRMEAGFEKQMPIGHPYMDTVKRHAPDLFGANRLTVVVQARQGDIWTTAGLTRLLQVTEAVQYLPNIDRVGVQSLWTPNSFVNEITEEGFRAESVIAATVTPASLTPEVIAQIQRSTSAGGHVGSLVSRDQRSAMVTAEILEVGADGRRIDYLDYNRLLEAQLRSKFEDADFEIQIIGFAKQTGDIADGAAGVLEFCAIALVLTALAVYWYCRSWRLMLLPIVCSLTSLVWQFGALRLLGYGLDPLGVLVPFLVFAIGVSHGVQQINTIVGGLARGQDSISAARESFSGLFVPGVLALAIALVSFITLLLIPIPMIRELAVTAALGVGFKVATNLVMLPVAASYCHFPADYGRRAVALQQRRAQWLAPLARIAVGRNAVIVSLLTVGVLAAAAWFSRDRVVGSVQPGAPELRADARFNRDAVAVVQGFDMGLDWLSLVFEAPPGSCGSAALADQVDRATVALRDVPGVVSALSYASMLRTYNEGYNEGHPKMGTVPLDSANLAGLATEIGRIRGFVNKDCSMAALHLYLTDHKAETLQRVLDAARGFAATAPVPGVTLRLAAGNAGVQAAINETVQRTELPMLLYVYGAIALFVLAAFRDWRAVLSCCLPLTVGTFVGYWFMKAQDIGLTVATLPVMVLAAGIGVDYALYIYSRLQQHLARGQAMQAALEAAIREVGMATIFTAITLAIGVATWAFSPLKFQADMGKLLAFMFLANLVTALVSLPALAALLERWFPRRGPVRSSGVFAH
ncbi:efflux RND transporter permease subunit [Pseudaquabacterium pictum]|uniref:RND transporter n=1 Tax=Pseudaquabacterium pictum TaxID=2315236 RepID=A0A480APS0_9BURK|nr:efflux RND transporter permease subunit [Rubrivivax pictus]GCL61665.1 RND transporter [Rubrivivax pictus]